MDVASERGATGRPPSPDLGLHPALPFVLVGVAAFLAAGPFARPWANPDSRDFVALARSLAAGHGFTYREPMLPWLDLKAFRSPGYPLMLAPLLATGGIGLALAVNGALHALTALQAGAIAARAAGRTAGRAVLAMVFLWPAAWAFTGQLVSETLFACLSACAIRVALDARTARGAVLAGALATAAVATRPVGVAVALGVMLALFKRAPRLAGIALAAAVLCYAPWPLRNARVLGTPVPFVTNSGFNLADGVEPATTDSLWREMSGWRPMGELAIDDRWRARWRADVAAHPAAEAARVARGFVTYLLPLDRELVGVAARVLAFLAVAGLLLAASTTAGGALGAAWLGQAAINAVTQVNARYRFPSEWIVPILAVIATVALRDRFGRRGVWAAGLLGVLGVALWVAQVAMRGL